MTMRTLLLCGALAIAAPAAAQTTTAPGDGQAPMAGGSMSMAAPSTPDYMMMAGQSDQFEIQEGQLAASQGKSAAVRKFGAEMVKDHTKSTQMIMAAARKSGMTPPPPPPLDAEQAQMLSSLQAMNGADFDRTYVSQQMTAHQKALALHQAYASGGTDPNFKSAAGKIVPVVEKHIAMLQHLASPDSMGM